MIGKSWVLGQQIVGHANPPNYQLGSPMTTVHRSLLLYTPHSPLHQSREPKGFSLLYLETVGLLASLKLANPPKRRIPPSPFFDTWLCGRRQGTKHPIWTYHSHPRPTGIDGWVPAKTSELTILLRFSHITDVSLQQGLSLYLFIDVLLPSSLLLSTCNHSEVLNLCPLVSMCFRKMCSWKSFE